MYDEEGCRGCMAQKSAEGAKGCMMLKVQRGEGCMNVHRFSLVFGHFYE